MDSFISFNFSFYLFVSRHNSRIAAFVNIVKEMIKEILIFIYIIDAYPRPILQINILNHVLIYVRALIFYKTVIT